MQIQKLLALKFRHPLSICERRIYKAASVRKKYISFRYFLCPPPIINGRPLNATDGQIAIQISMPFHGEREPNVGCSGGSEITENLHGNGCFWRCLAEHVYTLFHVKWPRRGSTQSCKLVFESSDPPKPYIHWKPNWSHDDSTHTLEEFKLFKISSNVPRGTIGFLLYSINLMTLARESSPLDSPTWLRFGFQCTACRTGFLWVARHRFSPLIIYFF